MTVRSFDTLTAQFQARYPNATVAESGTVGSISASAGTVPTIEAAAVRGFAALSGNLRWVKLLDHRTVRGQVSQAGDYEQIEEGEAKRLIYAGAAVFATDEEVRAAQSAGGLTPREAEMLKAISASKAKA